MHTHADIYDTTRLKGRNAVCTHEWQVKLLVHAAHRRRRSCLVQDRVTLLIIYTRLRPEGSIQVELLICAANAVAAYTTVLRTTLNQSHVSRWVETREHKRGRCQGRVGAERKKVSTVKGEGSVGPNAHRSPLNARRFARSLRAEADANEGIGAHVAHTRDGGSCLGTSGCVCRTTVSSS